MTIFSLLRPWLALALTFVFLGSAFSYAGNFKVYDQYGVKRLETCWEQFDDSYKCYDKDQRVTRIIRQEKEYTPDGKVIRQRKE